MTEGAGGGCQRLAVMGAGGIGGLIGARMAAAGHAVHLIARGPHLAAIREEGLRLKSEHGDVSIRPASATEEPSQIGPVDLVVFTVKGQDSAAAARQIAPLVGPETMVVSFQNGVAGLDHLAAAVGAGRLLPGVTFVPAVIEAPGVIRQTGQVNRFVFGEAKGPVTPRVQGLAEAMQSAGLDAVAVADAEVAVWHKFIMLAPFAAICCLTRLPLGDWIAVPETQRLYRDGMAEVAAVAQARGVAVAEDIVETNLAFALEQADPRTKASMLEDLERGKPLEVDSLSGHIARLGEALGIPTPVNALAAAALAPFVQGRGQRSS